MFSEKRFLKFARSPGGGPKEGLTAPPPAPEARAGITAAAGLTEKDHVDLELLSLLSNLDEKKFKNILETGKIEIKEKGISKPIAEFDAEQIGKLIEFCERKPEYFNQILEKITSKQITAGQLDLNSRKTLIEHYKVDIGKVDNKLKPLFDALLVSHKSISLTIEASGNDTKVLQLLFRSIPEEIEGENTVHRLNEDNLASLIEAGLYESLSKKLSIKQRAILLLRTDIDEKIQKTLFTQLEKSKVWKKDEAYLNAMVLYCSRKGKSAELKRFVIPKINGLFVQTLSKKTAKALLDALSSRKRYESQYKIILDNLPPELKAAIEEGRRDEAGLEAEKTMKWMFEQFPAKPRVSFKKRIEAAFQGEDEELGKGLKFHVPPDSGIKRSFLVTYRFKRKVKKCKNPAEVKLACYEHLFRLITRDGSIRTNKYRVKRAGESNKAMALEIERLTALIVQEGPLNQEQERNAQIRAKARLIHATLGKKGKGYKIQEDGSIEFTKDPGKVYERMQKKMGKTPAFTKDEFLKAIEPTIESTDEKIIITAESLTTSKVPEAPTPEPEPAEDEYGELREASPEIKSTKRYVLALKKRLQSLKKIKNARFYALEDKVAVIVTPTDPFPIPAEEYPILYFKPRIEFTDGKSKLKDIAFYYQKYFVGDLHMSSLGISPSDQDLTSKLNGQIREINEDIRDHHSFADLEKYHEEKNPEVDLEDPALEALADSSEKEWLENFERLQNKELYKRIFTKYFGAGSEMDVPALMLKIIQDGYNDEVDLNDLLTYTRNEEAEEFYSHFKDTLDKVRSAKGLVNPDGSPNMEALKKHADDIRKLRKYYNVYLGAMKILKTLETEKVLEREVPTAAEKVQHQLENAQKTTEQAYKNQYYNFEHIASNKKSPHGAKGPVQIGISEAAYKKLGAIDEKIPLYEILKALFVCYPNAASLVANGQLKKQHDTGDGITRLLLVDLPADFNIGNKALTKLLDYLQKEPTYNKSKLFEHQKQLSTSTETYMQYVLNLLKEAQSRALENSDVIDFFWTDTFDPSTEMTLTSSGVHHDVNDIRRFTSPEAFVQHLFGIEKVQIRIWDPLLEEYDGKETLSIFEWKNGVKIVNEKNLIAYFNYLINEGIQRRKRLEDKKERIYKFKDVMNGSFDVGVWSDEDNFELDLPEAVIEAMKNAEKAFKPFIQSPTLDNWKHIPGHQRIDSLLTGPPFDHPIDQIPQLIHRLLYKNPEEVNFDGIYNVFFKTKLESYVGVKIKNLKSADDLEKEYKYIVDTGIELQRKIEANDFEGTPDEKIQKKIKDEKRLSGLITRQLTLKEFIDGGAALISRLGAKKFGRPEMSFEHYRIEIEPGKSLLDLDPKSLAMQMDLMNGGHVSEMMRGEQRQMSENEKIEQSIEFSKYPHIAKIQREAFRSFNYPATEIPKIESRILVGIGLSFKGKSITGGGLAVPIDLGHDVTLVIGASTSGAGVQFVYKVVETESYTGTLTAGGGVDFSGQGFGTLAYISTHEISDEWDFSWAIGGIMTSTGPKVMVGLGFSYNEARATKRATELIMWKSNYTEVEKTQTFSQRAAAIRALPEFKKFEKDADKLHNIDIVALYEDWKNLNIMQGIKEGEPSCPITAIGAGVTIGAVPPFVEVFIGIKFRLGSETVIKPEIGEREKLAKRLSQYQISLLINEQLKGKEAAKRFHAFDSPKIYTTASGEYGLLEKTYPPAEALLSNVEELDKQLRKNARMSAKPSTVKVGPKGAEQSKEVVELSILDTKFKDVNVFIDDTCANLDIILDKKNQKIYIPGNLDNIIISRETFRYGYRKTVGGAATVDVIVITTNPSFNRHKVVEESKTFLEKRWEMDDETRWDLRNGANVSRKSHMHYLADFRGEKPGEKPKQAWSHLDHIEKIYGMSVEEYESITQTSTEFTKVFGGESLKAIQAMKSRCEDAESKTFIRNAYIHLINKGLKGGRRLSIYDNKKIIEVTNKRLLKKGQEILNTKETQQFLSIVQHRYFVNLWKRGREKIKKHFKAHNEYIKRKVLYPTFLAKIESLKITPKDLSGEEPAGPHYPSKKQYAKHLANIVYKYEWKKFSKAIDSLKGQKKPDFESLIKPIDGDSIIAIGTTIRTTKAGALSGGASLFRGLEVAKMGYIDSATTWELNSPNPIHKDIARIMMEKLSPTPSLEDVETLTSPFALKLVGFIGTGMELGKDSYKHLLEFYKALKTFKTPKEQASLLKETLNKKGPQAEAINAFVVFSQKVRNEMLDSDTQIAHIKLENGATMVCGARIQSAAYGECGNLLMMVKENFGILTEQKNIIVVSTDTRVHHKTIIEKRDVGFVLGISYEPKTCPPKKRPPPRKGDMPEKPPSERPPPRKTGIEPSPSRPPAKKSGGGGLSSLGDIDPNSGI